MRRWLVPLLAAGLLPLAPSAGATAARASLAAGGYLRPGQHLVSPDGRFHAQVEGTGRLTVRTKSGALRWRTPAVGRRAYLLLARTGQLSVRVAGVPRWVTHTAGSGGRDLLTMRDDGILELTSGGLTVWSTRLPYACPRTPAKVFVVDLSRQWARMCQHRQQLRATWVTTGASALGYGTPTGTWHVYAKSRNTTLYPAAGGAYPVKYWMPYSGPYGMHDSSWQKFAYGSAQYKTRGSHGCVHVPLPMMRWLYAWAPVGTRVTVHR